MLLIATIHLNDKLSETEDQKLNCAEYRMYLSKCERRTRKSLF